MASKKQPRNPNIRFVTLFRYSMWGITEDFAVAIVRRVLSFRRAFFEVFRKTLWGRKAIVMWFW